MKTQSPRLEAQYSPRLDSNQMNKIRIQIEIFAKYQSTKVSLKNP